jgi:hypothetical protein
MPTQRIRIVAGTPLEVGKHRLLPSVLVNTVTGEDSQWFRFGFVKLRPISIVEESPDGAHWIEIPNVTSDALSTMTGIGLGIAACCVVMIFLIRVIRGR